jgi:rRNA-processing protein FCF1|tara:strand:- start:76 stop:459 length:384 start_codon:yes stop_codon:yes gene_type:complete
MKKVIIDTNFLLIPIKFRVDIFSEIERICEFKYGLYIIDKTIDELDKIVEEQRGKDKEAAKIAKQLVKAKKVKVIKTKKDKYADDLIVEAVKKGDIVATQDKELKRRLKRKGVNSIGLRQKQYLIMN